MASGIFTQRNTNQLRILGGLSGVAPPVVEYLAVAGGGGGGQNGGGGGGAGGLLTGILPVSVASLYTVTIGGGGTGSVSVGSTSNNGEPSTFGTSILGPIFCAGGGGGGYGAPASAGAVGGSGGGSSAYSSGVSSASGAQGILGQGNKGGDAVFSSGFCCAGGGGAGSAGIDAIFMTHGAGGSGIASAIAGLSLYAGGGGGYNGTGADGRAAGGVGGGGAGGYGDNGISGGTNTGGGGGGNGGSGGSGIVSISYPVIYAAAKSTTGTPKEMISGSGAMQFNGKNCVTFPFSQGYLAANDFTIEAWVYPTTTPTNPLILIGQGDLGSAGGSSYYFSIGSSGDCSVYVGGTTYSATAPNPSANQWSHVAFVRTSGTLSTYLNGTRVGTTAISGTVNNGDATFKSSSGGISNPAQGANLTGFISNLRRIVGSGGYNAASSTITVPTSPLTATVNTNLLVFQDGYSPFKDASSSAVAASSLTATSGSNSPPRGSFLTPFASTTYTNIARVYEWTSSGSITF
jgi:hypothetical protein